MCVSAFAHISPALLLLLLELGHSGEPRPAGGPATELNDVSCNAFLRGVAVTSVTNAWAVGNCYSQTNPPQTLIERWNGTRSTVQPSPNPEGSPNVHELHGVAAISATNAWAVGDNHNIPTSYQTLIERWNGTGWTVQPSPNPGDSSHRRFLFGVAATSATNAWAVGFYTDGTRHWTLVERWNGTRWKVQPSPKGGSYPELDGVAATSATNAWAVGHNHTPTSYRTLIERWNGTHWKIQPSPNPAGRYPELDGVAATSATNAWAVGHYYTGTGYRPLIERWNGTHWKIQPSPNPRGSDPYLNGVTATSATNAWAVGFYTDGSLRHRTLIERWNGTRWKIQPSPNPTGSYSVLDGVDATSATNAWAVGDYFNGSSERTLMERWNGTHWKVLPSPNPQGSSDRLHAWPPPTPPTPRPWATTTAGPPTTPSPYLSAGAS